jgi:hypothetical protein
MEAGLANIRPFVADMPEPTPGESLLGYFSRGLSATICSRLWTAFKLATGRGKQNPRPFNITADECDSLAKLFKVDPSEFRSRLYPWGQFDHVAEAAIDFFGTKIRPQYLESEVRRVSPRSLSISSHHKVHWDLRPLSFDPDTWERLLDHCPVCKSRLGWSKLYGPSKCDKCVDSTGRPTDIREFKQPLIEVDDEEALTFVVGLVHPRHESRASAMRLVPPDLSSATSSDLFEAIITIASALLPGNSKRRIVGRPKTFTGFAEMAPDQLALAARALIGGESGFGRVADIMRASIAQRSACHGRFKELGPISALVHDPGIAPAIRLFASTAIERDLARTSDLGLVRTRSSQTERFETDTWRNLGELNIETGLPLNALSRLAESGQLPTKRADASIIGPIEMDRTAVLPLVASYKDAVGKQRAMSILRIPSGAVDQLADQNVIERINGVAAVMLGDRNYFSRSSIDAVLTGIRKRARNSRSTSKAVMLTAAVDLLRPNIPWATIVKLIAAGEIPVQDLANKSPDWRRNVGVRDLSAFLRLVERTSGVERHRSEEWLTTEQVMQILRVKSRLVVQAMSEAGLLRRRSRGRSWLFQRGKVEAIAAKFIFGPEMLEKSQFNIYHQLNRWLRWCGVEPALRLDKRGTPLYDRKKFEQALASPSLDLSKLKPRNRKYSLEEKRRIIETIESGTPIGYVSKAIGARTTRIAKWILEYRSSGQIQRSSKLELHQSMVDLIIKKNPSVTYVEIGQHLEKDGVRVAHSTVRHFTIKLGYVRDTKGCLRRHASKSSVQTLKPGAD